MPTPQQLKTELTTDPAGLGYSSHLTVADDQGLADILNAVQAGVAYSIFRNSIPVRDLIAAITASEYVTLTSLQIAQLNFLFSANSTLDATDLNTRNIVTTIFTGKASTLGNFAVVAKRQASRAEVAWGQGTFITAQQVGEARNFGN